MRIFCAIFAAISWRFFRDFLILMPKAISQDASSELIILRDRFFGNSRVEKWPINQSYQIRGSNRTGDFLGHKSP